MKRIVMLLGVFMVCLSILGCGEIDENYVQVETTNGIQVVGEKSGRLANGWISSSVTKNGKRRMISEIEYNFGNPTGNFKLYNKYGKPLVELKIKNSFSEDYITKGTILHHFGSYYASDENGKEHKCYRKVVGEFYLDKDIVYRFDPNDLGGYNHLYYDIVNADIYSYIDSADNCTIYEKVENHKLVKVLYFKNNKIVYSLEIKKFSDENGEYSGSFLIHDTNEIFLFDKDEYVVGDKLILGKYGNMAYLKDQLHQKFHHPFSLYNLLNNNFI